MNENGMDRTQKLDRGLVPTRTIPLICSWCNKIYRIEQWKFQENERTGVSHGICPECLASMHGELGEAEPAVDENGRPLAASEEIIYVDEDGNPIDPEAIARGEYVVEGDESLDPESAYAAEQAPDEPVPDSSAVPQREDFSRHEEDDEHDRGR